MFGKGKPKAAIEGEGLTFEDADYRRPHLGSEALEKKWERQVLEKQPEVIPAEFHAVYAWYCPTCKARFASPLRQRVLLLKRQHTQQRHQATARPPVRSRVVHGLKGLAARLTR